MSTLARSPAQHMAAADLSGPLGTASRNQRGPGGRGTALLVIALAMCLTGAACGGYAPRPAAPLRVQSCVVQERTARCGVMTVPEDRLGGTGGRHIKIRFVVVPAYGHSRAPDPVVYFAGGPGSSAISDIPGEVQDLVGLNLRRDLVFIDQRGTGGSNGLRCPPPPATLADQPQVRRSIDSCLTSLRTRADLRFYTTAMAAQDAAQVLTALGYGQVNIIGGSYGATAAQVFQQMFPGRVRTMTLQSGTLVGFPLFERFPQASQQALDNVFARCASDPACHGTFPRLAAQWAALRAAVAARPLKVPARQSPTGTAFSLDRDMLAAGVHEMLMSADTAAYVPLLIHSLAVARNRSAVLAAIIRRLMAAGLLTGDGVSVISYPIRCAEPWAQFQPGRIPGRNSYYYQVAVGNAQWWRYVCTLMPAPGAAARYPPQRASKVPVLMINGSADPQDPPANMAGARKIWPNSRLVIEPGQSHGIDLKAWVQCDASLVQAFIEQANAKRIGVSCLSQVVLPPFLLQW